MLTEVRLKNFIHFEGKSTFRFDKGLNILLGPNHTGKTSLFEAIRRCMSLSKSNGLSNMHDTGTLSYATCIFENVETKTKTCSSIVRLQNLGTDPIVLKLVKHYFDYNNEIYTLAGDVVSLRGNKLRNLPIDMQLFRYDPLDSDDRHTETILRHFADSDYYKSLSKSLLEEGAHRKTECENLLEQHVDKETVIFFPFRSFSPYPWTKSKRHVTEEHGELLDEISLKEEIVLWYLKQLERNEISEDEHKLEERYFRIITGNSGFTFRIIDDTNINKVGVENKNFSVSDPETENLLKIPEGIYEAKSAAIVLAVKQFRTICLDDAERGMHPQMIERLRDLVLQDINDKVVLLITHHPAFLAPWNISRTFLFRRETNTNGYKFSIKPLKDEIEVTGQDRDKDAQIITSGQFSSLFFAERICLVEGKTENIFMTALKSVLFKEPDLFQAFCPDDEEGEEFRKFLCTLHVVPMDGEAGKRMFHRICHAVGIPHYFILDFDAMFNNIQGRNNDGKHENRESNLRQQLEPFCKEFEIGTEKPIDWGKIKTSHDFVDAIEDHDFFIWKNTGGSDNASGTIENAVQVMCNKHSDVLPLFLRANNVKSPCASVSASSSEDKRLRSLKPGASVSKAKSKGAKKWKLFKDKKLTNRNIIEIVKKLIELSKDDKLSEFNRLVNFFKTKAISSKRI